MAIPQLEFATLHSALGQIVLHRRQELHLSQRALGALAGVHHATISLCERGKVTRGGFQLDTLTRLALALGMPLETLLHPYLESVKQFLNPPTV